jgi:hypothetical protein
MIAVEPLGHFFASAGDVPASKQTTPHAKTAEVMKPFMAALL